jgi:hypothetical protein
VVNNENTAIHCHRSAVPTQRAVPFRFHTCPARSLRACDTGARRPLARSVDELRGELHRGVCPLLSSDRMGLLPMGNAVRAQLQRRGDSHELLKRALCIRQRGHA